MEIKRKTIAAVCVVMVSLAAEGAASAAAPPTKQEMHKLMAPAGKQMLVLETYGATGVVVDRRKAIIPKGSLHVVDGTTFAFIGGNQVQLYGIRACQTDTLVQDGFDRLPCKDAAKRQLETLIQKPAVLLCRTAQAAATLPQAPATCFGYYYFPPGVVAVDNLEDDMVGLGLATLTAGPNGKPLRGDLLPAARSAQGNAVGQYAK